MPQVHFLDTNTNSDLDNSQFSSTMAPSESCYRESTPWCSAAGVSFKDALIEYLTQLDTSEFTPLEQEMIRFNTLSVHPFARSWYGPALPWSFESPENTDDLLPAMRYNFKCLGGGWTFTNLTFSKTWKFDPSTGTIVVPTLNCWMDILEHQNHYRQAHGWPLLDAQCYFAKFGAGLCTCDECPEEAERYWGPSEPVSSSSSEVSSSSVKSIAKPALKITPGMSKNIQAMAIFRQPPPTPMEAPADFWTPRYDTDYDADESELDSDWDSCSVTPDSPLHAPGNPYSYESDPDNWKWPADNSDDEDEDEDVYYIGTQRDEHDWNDENFNPQTPVDDHWTFIGADEDSSKASADEREVIKSGEVPQHDDEELSDKLSSRYKSKKDFK